MGQCDRNGHPNGLVRAIYKVGNVFDGMMSVDGFRNGWGIEYSFDGTI